MRATLIGLPGARQEDSQTVLEQLHIISTTYPILWTAGGSNVGGIT